MSFRVFDYSTNAKDYALYRPNIPDHITDGIIDQLEIKSSVDHQTLVLDIGCGSGQFTQSLARRFDRAMGFDISQGQIEEARSLNRCDNVEYGLSSAEKIPFDKETVDVVAVSNAAHWFNFPEFCREADRVLRPGGHIVIVVTRRKSLHHGDPVTDTAVNECNDRYMAVLDRYRLISLAEYDTFYGGLQFPYPETKRETIGVNVEVSAAAYLKLIKTMSFSLKYQEQNPETTFFQEFENSLQAVLQTRNKDEKDQHFQLTFWHDIYLGHKPAS